MSCAGNLGRKSAHSSKQRFIIRDRILKSANREEQRADPTTLTVVCRDSMSGRTVTTPTYYFRGKDQRESCTIAVHRIVTLSLASG